MRIQEIIKSESILIPDFTEDEIEKYKAESCTNSETWQTDTESYRGHCYSPKRMGYRDRMMLEKKFDYYLASAQKMANMQKANKKRVSRKTK